MRERMLLGYAIKREDGRWYAGTQDHNPIWGVTAAIFVTEEDATFRMAALLDRYPNAPLSLERKVSQ